MKLLDVKPEPFVQLIRCDKCGAEKQHDEMGFEEFVSIDHQCGYTTVEDDGKHVQVDLCYACFKEMLGPYWRVKSGLTDALGAVNPAKTRGELKRC